MNVILQSILISSVSVLMYTIIKKKDTQPTRETNNSHIYVGSIVFVVSLLLLSMTGNSTQLVSAKDVSASNYKPPF